VAPRATNEFRAALRQLATVSGAAAERVLFAGAAELDNLADVMAFTTDAYPEVITPFLAASGELTAQWYAEQPGVPDRSPRRRQAAVVTATAAAAFLPNPAAIPARADLARSGRWAMLQSAPAAALIGVAARHVFTQSRTTVIDNARDEAVIYIREAQATACPWCQTLVAETISGTPNPDLEAGGHNGCSCVLVPVRDNDYTPPAYAEQWVETYDEIVESGVDDPAEIAKAIEQQGDE
jgi:hypothetical protein